MQTSLLIWNYVQLQEKHIWDWLSRGVVLSRVVLVAEFYCIIFSGLSSAQNLLYELNKDLESIRDLPLNGDVLDVCMRVYVF